MDDILAGLLSPPRSLVKTPPVETRIQELPYDKLEWDNFERLCARLVVCEADVEVCRPYGTQGDVQEGIDIYAKVFSSERYTVYQCKREKHFEPAKIKNAISTFLQGDYVDKSETFVLCTMESLQGRKRTDEIEKQRTELKNRGIAFEVWDTFQLNIKLKEQPQLVCDFFGATWVKAFCGEEYLAQIKVHPPPKKKFENQGDYIPRELTPTKDDYYTFVKERVTLIELIKIENKIALLGEAGLGKTKELVNLAVELSPDSIPFYPVLIKLNLYTDREIKDYIPEIDQIDQPALVVCLDGLDEVQTGTFEMVSRKIKTFANDYPLAKIVVSCRSTFYTTHLEEKGLGTLQGFKSYYLANLNNHNIQTYLDHKLSVKKDSFLKEIGEKKLDKLLTVPYYLINLTDQFIRKNRIAGNKAELFEEIISESIYKDATRYFPEDREVKKIEMREAANKLAFFLECQGVNTCKWNVILHFFPVDQIQLLKRLGTILQGLDEDDAQWQFLHNNIQEYLTAKFISGKSFHEIKRAIMFPPAFNKVKPVWVNTLSFLATILPDDNVVRDSLLKWLIKHEPDLVIKFELDKLNEITRHNLFVRIFNSYKKENRLINTTKFKTEDLARFSMSGSTVQFLICELDIVNKPVAVCSALQLMSHIPVKSIFPRFIGDVKAAIEKVLFLENFDKPHLSLKAYFSCVELSREDFVKIIKRYNSSEDTWVRYTLFAGIHLQNLQDEFVDVVLDHIDAFINGRQKDQGRLQNEYMELRACISKVKTKEALEKVICFIAKDFGRVSYSISFQEIIQYALEIAGKLFQHDETICDQIVSLYCSDEVIFSDVNDDRFTKYFSTTNTTTKAFKALYYSNPAGISGTKCSQLIKLCNEETAKFIADEFEAGKIERKQLENFQYRFGRGHAMVVVLNQYLNKIQSIPLPNYRDYDLEKKIENDAVKEILFDKEKFKQAIAKVFDDAGTDTLTYEQLWDIEGAQYDGGHKYLPIVYTTIRFLKKGDPQERSRLIDAIENSWKSFFTKNVILFLKENRHETLRDDQFNVLKEYCDRIVEKVDFKTAFSHPTPDSTRMDPTACRLSFLIRRLNLTHYPTELYLDMLSFHSWDDQEINTFDFVERLVNKISIDKRVIANLAGGIKVNVVLNNHLNYITKNDLRAAAPLLIEYLKDKDQFRSQVLESFLSLKGELTLLEEVVPHIVDDFKFQVVPYLIKNNSQFVLMYVESSYDNESNEDERLKWAEYLMHLQHLKGVECFIRFVKNNKVVPWDSSASNPLYALRELKFLPHILTLYEMSFDTSIKHDSFNRLENIAIGALRTICLSGSNYPEAATYFKTYCLKTTLLSRLGLVNKPKDLIKKPKALFRKH